MTTTPTPETDAAILRAAPETSDDWDDATWAAWGRVADRAMASTRPADDTLPAWLHQRFTPEGRAANWDSLSDDDRSYWEHHARAVRRAVARGGFKNATTEEPAP
ncbi:hypothetical protein ACFW9I_03125 [[Kitasatospora] papulosa]|uniref:hypothetical protein n=1 Tax=[Kitasatospora] papulosa TaxID=1464011 RepID=UPI00369A36AB